MNLTKEKADKLMVTAGSMLTINGALLLASPGRFASIRKAGWMPDQLNFGLDWMARHYHRGRILGLGMTALGLLLIGLGFFRVPPTR